MNNVTIRRAIRGDLPAIVQLLADDPLGQAREVVPAGADEAVGDAYVSAFQAIDEDKHQLLAVAERGSELVGCLQLTFIPGLSRGGMWRGQIESVRVSSKERGTGLGTRIFEWAIETCRERGCGLVQLTSDNSREDAIRFYRSLGFEASHAGMKLAL